MRILLVGSSSMIGRRLFARLSKTHSVITVGRSGQEDILFDLENDKKLPNLAKSFDALIHCAASFGEKWPDDWIRNELVNSLGALRVAQLAQTAGCRRIVYLSSLWTYDHKDNGYRGSYGVSKRHGQENLALACAHENIEFTSLILPQIYDELGEARKHQPLFYRILECAARGTDFTLHGKTDPRRNFLFVEDVADIVEKVLLQQVSGIFPCLHPDSPKISQIVKTAYEVFDRGGKLRVDKSKPAPPSIYIPKDKKIYDALSYKPATSLTEGMEIIRERKTLESACTPS